MRTDPAAGAGPSTAPTPQSLCLLLGHWPVRLAGCAPFITSRGLSWVFPGCAPLPVLKQVCYAMAHLRKGGTCAVSPPGNSRVSVCPHGGPTRTPPEGGLGTWAQHLWIQLRLPASLRRSTHRELGRLQTQPDPKSQDSGTGA